MRGIRLIEDNMETEKRLNEAAEAGEIVTVVYHGGSQPGTKRRLRPIRATPMELRAHDLATDEVKTFLISKVEVVPDNHPAKAYIPGLVSLPLNNLIEALGPKITELKAVGWFVCLSEDSISVHRYFKNGKVRKGSDAGVLKTNAGSRPWYVFGPDLVTARTFSNLDKAAELFLEQALNCAPVKPSICSVDGDAARATGDVSPQEGSGRRSEEGHG
jgi:hypothetical protein